MPDTHITKNTTPLNINFDTANEYTLRNVLSRMNKPQPSDKKKQESFQKTHAFVAENGFDAYLQLLRVHLSYWAATAYESGNGLSKRIDNHVNAGVIETEYVAKEILSEYESIFTYLKDNFAKATNQALQKHFPEFNIPENICMLGGKNGSPAEFILNDQNYRGPGVLKAMQLIQLAACREFDQEDKVKSFYALMISAPLVSMIMNRLAIADQMYIQAILGTDSSLDADALYDPEETEEYIYSEFGLDIKNIKGFSGALTAYRYHRQVSDNWSRLTHAAYLALKGANVEVEKPTLSLKM